MGVPTPSPPQGQDCTGGIVDVAALIDRNRVSGLQVITFVLCGMCLVLDGFDVQAMGYVAPALIADWGVAKSALGPVFGAGLAGLLVGALTLSLVSDRIGRRPVLIGSTLAFSLCMLATAQVTSLQQLLALRFLTGIGLGAVMPNALALTGEYSPARIRTTIVMVISCGFTVGAMLGGFVSIALIGAFGWRAVFWFGGLAPLVLCGVMLLVLPESIQLLVLKNRAGDRVARWVRRIEPASSFDAQQRFQVFEPVRSRSPVVDLFRAGRAPVTLLLWAVTFMNLINLYFLANWLPTLITGSGYPQSTALLAGTMLQFGGTIGTLAMSAMIERLSFRPVLVAAFAVATGAIALIGRPELGVVPLFAVITIAGFCIVGAQPAINALAATYYPTALRATGLGWSLGIGRLGSIAGPVVAGALIGMNWSTPALFLTAAVPAALSAIMVIALRTGGGSQNRPGPNTSSKGSMA